MGERQKLPTVHEAWLPREHALHRPRHGGRQLTALISALLFFVTPTMLWVFGVRPAEIENHRLAGFPSLASGWAFFTGLPTWATDQLSFRSGAIQAADGISRGLFGESAPLDQGPPPAAGPIPGQSPPKDGTVPGQPSQPGAAGYQRVVQGSDGWLYFGFDADAKCHPTRPLTDTINKVNELRKAVEASGRKFVFVVAPDKSTMVPQFLPSSYPGKECSQAAEGPTWNGLVGQARSVDLRPELTASERRIGRPVYSSNDTHWRDEGSLVMTRGIADAIEPGVTRTWVSAPLKQYDLTADLPPLLGKQGVKTNTAYSLKPDGFVDRAGVATNDIDTPDIRRASPLVGTVDKRVLLLGDSFTKAASGYLPAAFTNLTMLAHSSNKIGLDATMNALVNSEVVVLEAVERNVSAGVVDFASDQFIQAAQAKLAANPLR